MRSWMIAAGLAAALAGSAAAEDNQAGLPLAPEEAAGPWTVQTEGRDVCVLNLSSETSEGRAGFALRTPATCGGVLPARPAGWEPTSDGMRLLRADGSPILAFGRWSNSLLVAHREGGADVQLRRGGFSG